MRAMMVAVVVLGSAAAWAGPATVLYNGQTVVVEQTLSDPTDLWVMPADLPRVNGFELKPEGACLDALCVPVKQTEDSDLFVTRTGQGWFNVTGLARKLGQEYVYDAESSVWSFGTIPSEQSTYLQSAVAPDFELKDRKGNTVRLSDFRGKKVLIQTWASWCGCRNDVGGWQKVYEDLKDEGFEILSFAEDTGGEAAAGQWFDRGGATFTQVVDENHVISRLYNMVNVPTGVWIDEEGRIVRPNETAYSSDVSLTLGGKKMEVNGSDYVAGLRDWVENGEKSVYALSPEEVAERIGPRTNEQEQAEAYFQLGNHFHRAGNDAKADVYWTKAQELRPDSWNYHRQDWSFTPKEAGPNWMKKYLGLGDQPYYEPLDLPAAQQ